MRCASAQSWPWVTPTPCTSTTHRAPSRYAVAWVLHDARRTGLARSHNLSVAQGLDRGRRRGHAFCVERSMSASSSETLMRRRRPITTIGSRSGPWPRSAVIRSMVRRGHYEVVGTDGTSGGTQRRRVVRRKSAVRPQVTRVHQRLPTQSAQVAGLFPESVLVSPLAESHVGDDHVQPGPVRQHRVGYSVSAVVPAARRPATAARE